MQNIAILKVTDEDIEKVNELAQKIGEAIKGITFILPFDTELLVGKLAKDELLRLKDKIDEVLKE